VKKNLATLAGAGAIALVALASMTITASARLFGPDIAIGWGQATMTMVQSVCIWSSGAIPPPPHVACILTADQSAHWNGPARGRIGKGTYTKKEPQPKVRLD